MGNLSYHFLNYTMDWETIEELHTRNWTINETIEWIMNMSMNWEMNETKNISHFMEMVLENFEDTSIDHLKLAVLLKEDPDVEVDIFDADFYDEAEDVTYFNLQHMAGCIADRYWYVYVGSKTMQPC